MGIKESFPIIMGKTITFNETRENNYFERSRHIIKLESAQNTFSDYNLLKSLEFKSFSKFIIKQDPKQARDITWIEYLTIHLNNLYKKYKASWISEFLYFINNKNIAIYENKHFSNFFFFEYKLLTIPKSLTSENEKISEEKKEYNNDKGDTYEESSSGSVYNNDKDDDYFEIDVLDNFGGSFREIILDEVTKKYKEQYKKFKQYIKIMKEHLYKYKDHPITLAVKYFNEKFANYIDDKIRMIKSNLNQGVIDEDGYINNIKNLEEEINFCLKEVISRMYSALKLFYSTTLDLKFLENDREDLFNLLISLFFRTGNLYRRILKLYMKSYEKEYNSFQEKLIKLKSISPKDVGLAIKFCLNKDTLDLQNELKEKKINENKENIEEKIVENKIEIKEKIEDSNNIISTKTGNIQKALYGNENDIAKMKTENLIFEGLKNANENDYKYDLIKNEENNNIFNIKYKHSDDNILIRSRTRNSVLSKEDNFILENISNIDNINFTEKINLDPMDYVRKTIDNFNNKTYFFPDLKKKFSVNLENSNSFLIQTNEKDVPYISAINLLKSLDRYKTPFEKIILLAAINDQIMESTSLFWKGMEPYIKKDFLHIEAEDIMSMFLFVLIKAQMPEILVHGKIIQNFTTEKTKNFSLAYNSFMLEACIEKIISVNNIEDLNSRNTGRDILNICSQRYSTGH